MHSVDSGWALSEARRLYEALAGVVGQQTVPLAEAVEMFLAAKLSEAKTGALSVGRYDNLARDLRWFRAFAGAGLDAGSLAGFVAHLRGRVSSAELSACSASCCCATVRQFVRWCWRRELIGTLPRNLDDVRISMPDPDVRVLEIPVFRTLVTAATLRLRLPLLLMANCGMTQQDVADLSPDEVDWSAWRISRKRSKTRDSEGVPRVSYALWPPTVELLDRLGNRDAPTVLCVRGGRPLKRSWINEHNRISKVDSIGRNYQRLLAKLGMRNLPPKLIRKTSASILESHREFGRYVRHFLGHAPRSIADKHYVVPSQDRFDEAVAWLGTVMIAKP